MCTATLAILDRLDEIDHETLAWWLAERQLPNGGLNGRPEKLEDVRDIHFIQLRSNLITILGVLQLLGSVCVIYPQEINLD